MKVSIHAVTVLKEAATIPCFLNCLFLLLLNSCEAASYTAYSVLHCCLCLSWLVEGLQQAFVFQPSRMTAKAYILLLII